MRRPICLVMVLLLLIAALPALPAAAASAEAGYVREAVEAKAGKRLTAGAAQGKYTTRIQFLKSSVSVLPGRKFRLGFKYWYVGSADSFSVRYNPSILQRTDNGMGFVAIASGTTTVTLYSGSCWASVTVYAYAKTGSVTVTPSVLTLAAGQSSALSAAASPDAARQEFTWKSLNPAVAFVSDEGVVTGMKAGKTAIVAMGANGKSARCAVTVTAGETTVKPVYRGLSIGTGLAQDASFADKVIFPLEAKNFADFLARLTPEGGQMTVKFGANPTKAQAVSWIKSAFAGSRDTDVNYLYLMCHGAKPTSSNYEIALGTDATITSRALRALLDGIPGRWVLILSCCYSGDVVGKGTSDFARGFVADFTGPQGKSGELIGSRYKILCGSSRTQPGWVRYYQDLSGAWSLGGGAVARAGGWNYIETNVPAACPLYGDADGDGKVTLRETYEFAAPLVKSLYTRYGMSDPAGVTQMCVYPMNDDTVLFERQG